MQETLTKNEEAKKPAPQNPPPVRPPAQSPAPSPARGRTANAPERTEFVLKRGIIESPQKVVIYGPGGVGKTHLAALLREVGINPLFIDLEAGSNYIDVDRVLGINNWTDLRAALRHPGFQDYQAVVVDSLTMAEELAVAHTLATVPHERGMKVDKLEGYGYGKGYSHVYDTFLPLLSDLDAHIRDGRHVICIAHDTIVEAPNPHGENYLRYEPRLQRQRNGDIRSRVKEWCDHMVFIGYDIMADDGKARGAGTRHIFVLERPAWIAKSRTLTDPIPYYRGDATFWRLLFNK